MGSFAVEKNQLLHLWGIGEFSLLKLGVVVVLEREKNEGELERRERP